jgi:hypothetical protein
MALARSVLLGYFALRLHLLAGDAALTTCTIFETPKSAYSIGTRRAETLAAADNYDRIAVSGVAECTRQAAREAHDAAMMASGEMEAQLVQASISDNFDIAAHALRAFEIASTIATMEGADGPQFDLLKMHLAKIAVFSSLTCGMIKLVDAATAQDVMAWAN